MSDSLLEELEKWRSGNAEFLSNRERDLLNRATTALQVERDYLNAVRKTFHLAEKEYQEELKTKDAEIARLGEIIHSYELEQFLREEQTEKTLEVIENATYCKNCGHWLFRGGP